MVKGVFLTQEEFDEMERDVDIYRSFYHSAQRSVKNNAPYSSSGKEEIIVDIEFISKVLGYEIKKENSTIRFK